MLTDFATGWTECAPLLMPEQVLVTEVLGAVRKVLPFALLGFDTDNDRAFMKKTVRDYCVTEGVEFTRCRPYPKNDQAHVEQKNGAVVRRIVGYRRFEGLVAAATPYQRALADARVPEEVKAGLRATAAGLDPVVLLRDIRAVQQRLLVIADSTEGASARRPRSRRWMSS